MILSNVRKQFIADPDYTICDADLAGADAQVVAWEADDASLKNAFRRGEKIHIKNARDMFTQAASMTDGEIKNSPLYKDSKILCHATNYTGQPPNLSASTGWPISDIQDFQYKWFALHPNIKEWHSRTLRFLEGSQCWNCNIYVDPSRFCPSCSVKLGLTIRNRFGYRRIYAGEPTDLLSEAVAWGPQSTVAIVTQRGLFLLRDKFPYIQILLQVHDSLVFQIPTSLLAELPKIKAALDTIAVPYDDPLTIPWDIASADNWGACG